MRLSRLSLGLLAAIVCVGCGSHGSSTSAPRLRPASLVLDFTPNPVHTGIYSALAQHFDRDAGLRLHVIAPSASTDGIKLLQTGKVDFAIVDIHDLAIARERKVGIRGIMAIVERPLAAVIAGGDVRTPQQLQGRTVGITGVPSDTAVLHSIVAGAGGRPDGVKTITIGFNAVADLLAGRVAAATAFWSDEGVTLAARGRGFHSFKVDQYGAPAYPELVLCATARTIQRDRALSGSVVRALTNGYAFTTGHPARAAAELESLVPGLDPTLVSAQLRALLPAFRAAGGAIGELNGGVLGRWAAWEARFGIVRRPPDVATAFDPSFAAPAR
jgi:putative hydroxymethylpyrimidine transport system substrate-binding protein